MSKKQPSLKQAPKKDSNKSIKAVIETQQQKLVKENRQKQLLVNLNYENMKKYLMERQFAPSITSLVQTATEEAVLNVSDNIKGGKVEVTQKSYEVQKLLFQEKISKEEAKELELKAKRDFIQKKIQYLNSQRRSKSHSDQETSIKKQHTNKQEIIDFKDILSKEDHQQRIKQIYKEKHQRKQRNKHLLDVLQNRNKEEEQKRLSLINLQKSKQKEVKRTDIEKKIHHRKQQHQKFVSQEVKLKKQYEQVKNKKNLYQQLELKYQSEVLLPILQEKKQKIQQTKQFRRRYDVEAIKLHQKQYLEKKLASHSKIQNEGQNLGNQKDKSEEHWKYNPPARTQKLTRLLSEQQTLQKQKLEEKKHKIQEKIQRQQEFIKVLKKKYQPKVDTEKQKQIESRLLQDQRKRHRVDIDSRKLGIGYLQTVKRMVRSESVRSQVLKTEKQDSNHHKTQKKAETQHGILHHNSHHQRSQQYFQNARRKHLQQILSSQENPQQKYLKLKMETDKINLKIMQKEQLHRYNNDQQAQNETAELILASIKAKMGMMSLFRNGQQHV